MNEEIRTNKVLCLVGDRGTGKTDFLKDLVRNSPQPKHLIVDTFDSAVWRNMKTWDNPQGEHIKIGRVLPDQLSRWKTGTYRMFDSDTDSLMSAVQKNMMNALVIFEDATKYIGKELTKDVKYFIIDSKQKNLDLVFVFHSLKDLPSDLVRIMDFITICKTGDKYNSSLRSKYPDAVEDAFAQVMASPNRFEKITIAKG